jgi:glutamate racemase
MRRGLILFIISTASVFGGTGITPQAALDKDEVTILITDSGLGGLSVAADFERRLSVSKQFKKVQIIFANALPGEMGYNDMKSTEEKAVVFSEALFGMVRWFHPDVIVIACNTLSVVYPQTEFSRTATIPVIGIVEIAVEMISEKLKKTPLSSAIIFGTETTIASNAHKEQLLAHAVNHSRIVTQACPKLETEIQTDPTSDIVQTYIEWYVDEAVANLPKESDTVFAGMCCTHYGYSAQYFTEALHHAGIKNPVVVNPNTAMSEYVLPKRKKTFSVSGISVTVVSRAVISEEEIRSIASLIRKDSEPTAKALEQYILKKDLFHFSLN